MRMKRQNNEKGKQINKKAIKILKQIHKWKKKKWNKKIYILLGAINVLQAIWLGKKPNVDLWNQLGKHRFKKNENLFMKGIYNF